MFAPDLATLIARWRRVGPQITALVFALAGSVGGFGHAAAAAVTLDIAGKSAADLQGSLSNDRISLAIDDPAKLVGVAWSGRLSAADPSWLSESTMTITNTSTGEQITISPGAFDEFSGESEYSGFFDLLDYGAAIDFNAGDTLSVEFWETYDDLADAPDSTWIRGNLELEFQSLTATVAEPPSWALISVAAALLAAGRSTRRRTQNRGLSYPQVAHQL